MLRVLFCFSPIAGQTSSPVPDPQNAQMITVNHQLCAMSSLSLSLIYYLILKFLLSSNSLISSYLAILITVHVSDPSHISSSWRLLLLPPLASVSLPVPAHVLNTTYSSSYSTTHSTTYSTTYCTTYSISYYTTRSCFTTFPTSLRHLFQ